MQYDSDFHRASSRNLLLKTMKEVRSRKLNVAWNGVKRAAM